MGTGNEDEEIAPNERPRPVSKRRNSALRILCGLIVAGIILLIVIIVLIVVLGPSDSSNGGRDENDKWEDLLVPPELGNIFPFNESRKLKIPTGYIITAYARVPSARFILPLPGGDVLISQPDEGKISLLENPKFRARPAQISDFATGLNLPNHMVLYTDVNDDQYIYFSEATRVSRCPYVKGDKRIRTPNVVVDNLPYTPRDLHPYKSIAIVNNSLYVAIGSSLDANPTDLQTEPKRGAIYSYPLDGGEGQLISSGLRHVGNLAVAPDSSDLWAVVNQRDNLTYPYKDKNYGKFDVAFQLENPVDEFVKIVNGESYGWPHCNPVLKDKNYGIPKYVPDYDFNRDEKAVPCSSKRFVDAAIRAHTKPTGLSFWDGKNVKKDFKSSVIALVVLSDNMIWGYKVIYYPWWGDRPGITPSDLVSGWIIPQNVESKWGQPVDVAVLDDDSVLISDNFAGVIYKLYKRLDY